MAEIQEKIQDIENKINKLIDVIGTKSDADDLEKELEHLQKEKNKRQEGITSENKVSIQKQTISHIINLIKNTKNTLMENNEDLKVYFNEMRKNKYMIDNFCNYANTALNIRDKARLIMHIKDDLEIMNQNVNQLEGFDKSLESIRNLGDITEKKISDDRIKKLKVLIDRAERQKKEMNDILEVYREMVEYMNEKLISNFLDKN